MTGIERGRATVVYVAVLAALLVAWSAPALARPAPSGPVTAAPAGAAPDVDVRHVAPKDRLAAAGGRPLTARGATLADTLRDYLRRHRAGYRVDDGDLATLQLAQRDTSPDGVSHIGFAQVVGGVPVFQGTVRGDFDRIGRLIDVAGAPVPVTAPGAPAVSAAAARDAAAASVGGRTHRVVVARTGGGQRVTRFAGGEQASLVLFPVANGARLAWQTTVDGRDPYMYEVVVDAATGRLLYRRNLTDFDNTALAFENWPGGPGPGGTQRVVNLGADPSWVDNTAAQTRLWGNNAEAYADLDASNTDSGATEDVPRDGTASSYRFPLQAVAAPGQSCPTTGCTWNPADVTSKQTNRKEATVQAFYYVNKFHDHLKAAPIGFDEASGNFQRVNPSGQGAGDDAVHVEADDGGGSNNANMSTPPDGQNPRMQMFFFLNSPFGAVNGSDESDVVYHEYGHGLSHRLIPTLSGTHEEGAMGEAWSDFYAMDFLVSQGFLSDTATPGELLVGDYVSLGTRAIRTQAIDCPVGVTSANCPGSTGAGPGGYDLSDYGKVISGPEVHADGEIWGETLWDIRRALGSQVALTLVTGGMRLSPPDPSMLDMRDAIVREDAAAYGSAHFEQLAQIFAARGMGTDAFAISAADDQPQAGFTPAAAFAHRAVTIDDAAPGGDGDHVAEPGESFRFSETAQSLLASPLSGASAALTAPSAGLTPGGSATFASWPADASATSSATLSAKLAASAPCGTDAKATLRVSGPTATVQAPISIPVGARVATAAASSTTDVAIPDNTPGGIDTTITVSGAGAAQGPRITIGSLTHTFDSDVTLTLTHAGQTATLLRRKGGDGANFTGTVFADDAATGIGAGTAPFTGTFRPETPLSVFDGTPRAGEWTLHLVDGALADTGALHSWSVDTGTGGPCSVLPGATTDPAGSLASTGARLAGRVEPRGTLTSGRFEYGTTAAYGTQTPVQSAGSGNTAVPLAATLSGLKADTTYHYRALALRGTAVQATGADATFHTPKKTVAPKAKVRKSGTARLDGKRAFAFAFTATPRAKGKVSFKTTKKLKIGKRRKFVSLGSKSWTASKAGKVKVTVKLSRANARLLKARHKLTLTASVTVRGGKTVKSKLVLKPPKAKHKKKKG